MKYLPQLDGVYLKCRECKKVTLRYSSTIDGLRCQTCGAAYVNCKQVEKMMQQQSRGEPWTPDSLHAEGIFTVEQMCEKHNASIAAPTEDTQEQRK